MIHRIRIFKCLVGILFCSNLVYGQNENYKLHLQTGDIYFLETSVLQETRSESNILDRNLSLELKSKITFHVTGQNDDGNYLMKCKYSNLHLSFFSPQKELYINSQNKEFFLINKYLAQLEEKWYEMILSPFGECLQINGIDSIITNLSNDEAAVDSLRKQLFIKTIREAFGNSSFTSLINSALYIYTEDENPEIKKNVFFNAREIPIKGNFIYREDDNYMRIQGIAAIEEIPDTIYYNDFTIISSIKGYQAYDYLADNRTGWLEEGISKQKFHSISVIKGHKHLPDGLNIPSLTISDYTFTGGQLNKDQKDPE